MARAHASSVVATGQLVAVFDSLSAEIEEARREAQGRILEGDAFWRKVDQVQEEIIASREQVGTDGENKTPTLPPQARR